MSNTKTTKRALLASVLSLLLCVSMLVSSTFAWFTDSASTGVNTITSGNLDIKLSYKNETVKSWTEVNASSKLFNDAALWEPGYTEVAYLKIENNGNLALKYQLTVNVINEVIGTSVLGNEIKLSKVLKYDLIELASDTVYADRAAALDAIEGEGQFLATETVSGSMKAESAPKYFALIVYMPTTVGNEANHNGNVPSIQLGINLVATQYTSEVDSFDDQYDKDASFPIASSGAVVANEDTVITVTKAGSEGQQQVIATATVPYEVSAAANATGHTLSIEKKEDATSNVTITGSGLTYDVSITNIPEGNTEIIPVSWYIGTGAIITELYHDTVKMTEANTHAADTYSYDPATGMLTIYVTHFSEFSLGIANGAQLIGKSDTAYYATVTDAVTEANDGNTIVLLKDATGSCINITKSVMLDLNGYSISNKGMSSDTVTVNGTLKVTDSSEKQSGAVYSDVSGKAAIKNLGTVTIDGGYFGSETTSGWYAITNYGTMTINGGHVENTADNASTASLIRNGCTDPVDTGKAEIGTLVINGGIFETTNGSNVLKIETGSVEINDGHLIMNGKAGYSGVIQCEAQLVINGGTVEHAKNYSSNGLIWTDTVATEKVNVTINGGLYKSLYSNEKFVYPTAGTSDRKDAKVVINKAESVGFMIARNADIASTSVWMNAQRADESSSHTIIVPPSELGDIVELENSTAGTYFADSDYYEPKPTSATRNLTFYVYKSFDIEKTIKLTSYTGTITFYLAEGADIDKLTYAPYSEDYLVTVTESTDNLPEARLGKTFVKCITVKYDINPATAIMKVVNADGSVLGYYMSISDASKAITDTTAQKIVMQRDLDNSAGGYTWSYSCTVDMEGNAVVAGSTYAISCSSSGKAFVFNNGTLKTLGANTAVIKTSGSGTTITANDCTIIGDKISLSKGSLILNNTVLQPTTEGATVTVTLGNTESTLTVKGGSFGGAVVSDVVGYDVVTTENADGSVTYSLAEGKYVELIRSGATVETYATLADALSAATAGDTLKLIKDIDQLSKYPSVSKNVTIDLNGYTIRGRSATAVVLVSGASVNLTVTDSSEAGTGAIINYNSGGYVYNAISSSKKNVVLNIQGGTYTKLNLTQTTATLNLSGNINAEEISNKGTTVVTEGTYNFDVSNFVDTEVYAYSTDNNGIYTVYTK